MLKRGILFLSILFPIGCVIAQTGFTYQVTDLKTAPGATIDFSSPAPMLDAKLTLLQAAYPSPKSDLQLKKMQLDKERLSYLNNASNSLSKKAGPPAPQVGKTFFGNVSQGTPNDNDIAVSNSGKFIISATNTNYNIYNDTGKYLKGRTLAVIANQLGSLNRTFDPRVIYDPLNDRFIGVFLQGSTHDDTRIIVGFTQTEDPTATWKFYSIPGNLWGDSSWSDYPIISITKEELFITVNRVKDNTPWQTGFIESLIWQVGLKEGYAGDTIVQKVYSNIKFNGKSIWSICPARGGAQPYGPNMYFISLRPSDLSNDTVFIHEITNTIASGNAELKLTVRKSNTAYGLQPNAIQPTGQWLQTNDARALSAIYEDEKIQFVGNCMYKPSFGPGFYHGVVDYLNSNPVVKGKVIGFDTMDVGYPSIAYAGTKGDNNSAMITCSYVSKRSFPGTIAFFVDRNWEYSAPSIIKKGDSGINMLTDSIERWGDYTGIQKKYNSKDTFWLNGSYGTSNQNNTWIGSVKNLDPRLGISKQVDFINNTTVYPNPAAEFVNIEFTVSETAWLTFTLLDINGKVVSGLLRDKAKAGVNRFSLHTSDLSAGIYYIQISNGEKIFETHKIIVGHQ